MIRKNTIKYYQYKVEVVAYICMFFKECYKRYDELQYYDVAVEEASELADKFINSKYDNGEDSFYECVERFLKSKKVAEKLKECYA